MIKERGVKRIVLLSRKNINQLDHNTSQFKNWINLKQIADENNAFVKVIKADVTDLQQVLSVLRRINKNKSYPVRGIIHSAMVLRDSLLKNMTENLLSEVMQPKIRGAWNLHHATESLLCPIHFFIMFSSIRNHIPDIGQSNYNAGNNFLDSLAYWRLNYRNLPAISIGLPAISGAGYLHNNAQATIKLMEEQGIHLMPSNYVFKMIEQLQFIQQQTLGRTNLFNPVMFVVNWKKLLQANLSSKLVHFANEFLKIKNENQDSTISSNDNQQLTLDIDTITNKIRLAVSKLFGSLNADRIDVNKPLVQQGMDSLIAVELRSWLLKEMFFNTPLVELVQGMSINDLASYIQNKSLNKQTKINTTTNSNNIQDLSDIEINTNEYSLLNNEMKDIKQSEMSSNGTSLIIPLYHSNSKYSLFCIHDIIGLSQAFIQFAIQLQEIYQNDCPSIFAFRASGYESNESFFQSIEIIAEQYIFQMKRIQPTGPYHLIGYSFGGIVAYEMVRQLYNKHQTTVQSLILIDPPVPVQQNILIPKEYDQKQFWLLRTIGLILSYFNKETNPDDIIKQFYNSSLSNEERKEKLENLMQQVLLILKNRFSRKVNDQIATENHEDTMAKKIFEVIKAQTIAKEYYTYDLAKNSKESIKIKKAIMFTLKQNNQYTSSTRKHRVWKSLLPQLSIENIDGTHDKLLETPSVRLIVDRLKQMNII
jgi:thioesterase domain-containing protein/acyl carrier protein